MKYILSISYIILFWLIYLMIFSFSSFFHRFLNYDFVALEEWSYFHRLTILSLSKLFAYFLLLVLPQIFNMGLKKYFLSMKFAVTSGSILRQEFKVKNRWPFFLILCGITLHLLYSLHNQEAFITWGQICYQVLALFIFFGCDFLVMHKLVTPLNLRQHPVASLLGALSLVFIPVWSFGFQDWSAYGGMLGWFLMMFYFYLFLEDKLSLVFMLFLFCLFHEHTYPLSIVNNSNDTIWQLTPKGFSLPWIIVPLFYFLVFVIIERYHKNKNILIS